MPLLRDSAGKWPPVVYHLSSPIGRRSPATPTDGGGFAADKWPAVSQGQRQIVGWPGATTTDCRVIAQRTVGRLGNGIEDGLGDGACRRAGRGAGRTGDAVAPKEVGADRTVRDAVGVGRGLRRPTAPRQRRAAARAPSTRTEGVASPEAWPVTVSPDEAKGRGGE